MIMRGFYKLEIININSYYFSSSLYMPMEEKLLRQNLDIKTYVPVSNNYKIRKEIQQSPPEHVTVSKDFNKIDRIIFHVKHNKIKSNFFKSYNLNSNTTLHAHSLFSNGYIAYSSYKKFQTPYIVAVRSTDINVFFKKAIHLRSLGIKILVNAKKVIFLSKPYMEKCIKTYIPQKYRAEIKRKSIVIPNGIDDFWYDNKLTKAKRRKTNQFQIIFVGDDSKRKNLLTLIHACDLLHLKHLEFKLVIVGQINDKKLRSEVKNRQFIEYKGYLQKEELLQEYRKSELFVLPSITETFGLVYPEAMSQGLPVIYTQGQGFDGHFKQGIVGYAVDPKNPWEIAGKIISIGTRYNEVAMNVLELVDKFKWDTISETYNYLYKDILDN